MTLTLDAPAAAPTADDGAVPRRRRITSRTWDRMGFGALLVVTAVMYLWNITVNGMGNQFYAAAAQAGSKNWEALLFGSLDSNDFITVDKPPVSQWVMGLSGQLFGFSSASMLIPQALMAVLAVALLYGAVRRISGPHAALLAGAALALMPVAALMFRYNNPDAVMVLLMMAAAYCAVRALERASAQWIALAGVALGFAFLSKMLEGIMVMPAIGLVYLIAAPTTLRKRFLHLLGALLAFLVSAGWFVGLTLLWPASSRPYIAGSTDNNFMNLVLGTTDLPASSVAITAMQSTRRSVARRPVRSRTPDRPTTPASAAPVTKRPGWDGSSLASSASKSAGCCPLPCWRWPWCSSRDDAPRALTSSGRPPSSSAVG